MTLTFIDRSAIRSALATLFTNALVGSGKPVKAVYDYQVESFGEQSPVIVVTSSGSTRRNPLKSPRNSSVMFFDVHIFVLYADPTATPAWTASNSETRLDLIEKDVAELIALNNGDDNTKPWMFLDFSGQSVIEPVVIGGKDYRHEVIGLEAEVKPG